MAIAFDNASAGSFSASGTSNSYSKTNTGSNLVLLTGLLVDNTSVTATAKYNGVTMGVSAPVNVGTSRMYIFYLQGPATGSNTVAITLSGSCQSWSYSVSYTGCYQGVPFPDASASTSPGAQSTVTATVVTTVDNCWTAMWGVNQTNTNPISASTGSTLRTTVGDGIAWFDSNAVIHPSGTNNMSFTQSGGPVADGAYIVSIAPTGAVYGGLALKSLLGVGI